MRPSRSAASAIASARRGPVQGLDDIGDAHGIARLVGLQAPMMWRRKFVPWRADGQRISPPLPARGFRRRPAGRPHGVEDRLLRVKFRDRDQGHGRGIAAGGMRRRQRASARTCRKPLGDGGGDGAGYRIIGVMTRRIRRTPPGGQALRRSVTIPLSCNLHTPPEDSVVPSPHADVTNLSPMHD